MVAPSAVEGGSQSTPFEGSFSRPSSSGLAGDSLQISSPCASSALYRSCFGGTVIDGCVDTASGCYFEWHQDLYDPISRLGVERFHVSSLYSRPPLRPKYFTGISHICFDLLTDWAWNLSTQIGFSPRWLEVSTLDVQRFQEVIFKRRFDPASLYVDSDQFKKWNNLGSLYSGGRVNPANRSIQCSFDTNNRGEEWIVTCADGTTRHFDARYEWGRRPDDGSKHNNMRYWRAETYRDLPSGLRWDFEHKGVFDLLCVSGKDRHKEEIYCIEKKGLRFVSVLGELEFKENLLPGVGPNGKTNLPYVTKVKSTGKPLTKYEYQSFDIRSPQYNPTIKKEYQKGFQSSPYIVKVSHPEGRYRKIDYHEFLPKQHRFPPPYAGYVKALKAPCGEGGEEKMRYQFDYEGRVVKITDGVGSLKEHHFDTSRRLVEVRRYLQPLQEDSKKGSLGPYQSTIYQWSEEDPSSVSFLEQAYLKDESGFFTYGECYEYDEAGNITSIEELGSFSRPPTISHPDLESARISCESRRRCYTYGSSGGIQNLLVKEERSNGESFVWEYEEGTDLPIARFYKIDDRMVGRSFWQYNRFAQIKEFIEDDGTGEHPYDFKGVHLRRLVRQEFYDEPGHHLCGLVKKRETFTCDPSNGAEILMESSTFHYNDERKVTREVRLVVGAKGLLERHYRYDLDGHVIKETTPDGEEIFREYDPNHRLIKEVRGVRRITTHFTYDLMNRCVMKATTHHDLGPEEQFVTRYRYDLMGHLTEETTPEGMQISYLYDALGRCIEKSWEQEGEEPGIKKTVFERYRYDRFDRCIEKIDALGGISKWIYTSDGLVAFHRDPTGRTIQYEYDGFGSIRRKEDSRTGSEYYEYDEQNRLVRKKISVQGKLLQEEFTYDGGLCCAKKGIDGVVERMRYDGLGKMIEKVIEAPGDSSSEWTRAEAKPPLVRFSYSYDAAGRCIEEQRELPTSRAADVYKEPREGGVEEESELLVHRWVYDGLDRILEESEETGGGLQLSLVKNTYDRFGFLSSTSQLKRGQYQSSAFVRNSRGDLLEETDHLGVTKRYKQRYLVDEGRVSRCHLVEKEEGLGAREVCTYRTQDGVDRELIARKVVSLAKNRDLSKAFYAYNAAGSCIYREEVTFDPESFEQICPSRVTKLRFDTSNRMKERIDNAGGEERRTRFSYGKQGYLQQVVRPSGLSLTISYDPFGRIKKQESSDRSLLATYNYNDRGLLTAASTTTHIPPELSPYLETLGSQCEVLSASLKLWQERVTFLERSYNSLGHCVLESLDGGWYTPTLSPGSSSPSFSHQKSGPLSRGQELGGKTKGLQKKPGGWSISRHVDPWGRAHRTILPDVTIARSYRDLFLSSITLSSPWGQALYRYEERDPCARSTRESLRMISSKQEAPQEEGMHREALLFEGVAPQLCLRRSYDHLGRLHEIKQGSLAATENSLDSLKSQGKKKPRTFLHERLTRDAHGRLESLERKHLGASCQRSFRYDLLGQIISEKRKKGSGKGAEEEQYDYRFSNFHDRISYQKEHYKFDQYHQLFEVEGGEKKQAMRHDLDGRMTHYRVGNELYLLGYDALDHLTSVALLRARYPLDPSDSFDSSDPTKLRSSYDLSTLVFYRYDVLGRRVGRWFWSKGERAPCECYFVYDGMQEIGSLERDQREPGGEALFWRDFRMLGHTDRSEQGETLCAWDATGFFGLYHDLEGSIVARIDPERGEVVRSQFYGLFGEEAGEGQGDYKNRGQTYYQERGENARGFLGPWGYRGKRQEALTLWYCFGARDYLPLLGRWLTKDPLGEMDGTNPYAYLKNAPLLCFDSWGLFGQSSDRFDVDFMGPSDSMRELEYVEEIERQLLEGMDLEEMRRHGAQFHLTLNNLPDTPGGAPPDLRSKTVVVNVNGINTPRSEIEGLSYHLASSHNVHVLSVINPTKGLFRDLMGVFSRMYLKKKPSKDAILSKMCLRGAQVGLNIGYERRALFFAHSEGEIHGGELRRRSEEALYEGLTFISFGGIAPAGGDIGPSARIVARGDWFSSLCRGGFGGKNPFHSHSTGRSSRYLAEMDRFTEALK